MAANGGHMAKYRTHCITVTLREKTLRDSRRVLYLDIYHHGKRTYDYLKLYLTGDKTHDAETCCIAGTISR